jgi:hypothetical protein
MPASTFRAGAAEAVITPPVGTRLEGYGARTSGSVGVHDHLHARAVVIDDGETMAAIAGCDLIGIDRRLSAAVRAQVHAATGMPGARIMVSATHTHGGPAGLRTDIDPGLTDYTARAIAGAIIEAHAALRPAIAKFGRGSVDTVQQNRRDPDGPIDPALGVLLLDSPDRAEPPVAAIVNFACHGTVLYSTNLHISADYAGAAVETVKGIVGEAPVIFLNGACGDVNPAWVEQDFTEVQRVGSIVGAEAARRIQELRTLGRTHRAWNIRWEELTDKPIDGSVIAEPRIRVASRIVDAPLRALEPPEHYDRRIAELRSELQGVPAGNVEARRRITEQLTMLGGTRAVAAQLGAGGGSGFLHPEVQAIGLSPAVAVLGLPGEFFVQTAEAIRRQTGIDGLMVSCYTNQHAFYVVPRAEWARGGYEPGVSVLDESAEEILRAAAIDLLRDVTTAA